MASLTDSKLAQASDLVAASGLDAWLVFVRETSEGGDPVLPLILDGALTWQTALLLYPDGKRKAIVGNYDADPLRASGNWHEVIPYVQSIREPLRAEIERSGAKRIGLNFSTGDVKADGLTHGMFLLLKQHLDGLPVEYVSAENVAMSLRGQKTPDEIARMLGAIQVTDDIFGEIGDWARIGVSEREIYDRVHESIRTRQLGFAWDSVGDPIVNSGPNSMVGHGIPSPEIAISPGQIFHIDLGVVKDGYSSDLQRCWFVGDDVPSEVRDAFDVVNMAITTGADALRPGVPGWQVDEAARNVIKDSGYDEYLHALGHQVGRVAHDGGTILGPRWERYGSTPYREVQEDEVYTIELGVVVPHRGYLGLEEMVRVTSEGCEWLSTRQLDLWKILD